jgi:hypothetical protein
MHLLFSANFSPSPSRSRLRWGPSSPNLHRHRAHQQANGLNSNNWQRPVTLDKPISRFSRPAQRSLTLPIRGFRDAVKGNPTPPGNKDCAAKDKEPHAKP